MSTGDYNQYMYIIYENGLCIQTGHSEITSTSTPFKTITLNKPYKNIYYLVFLTQTGGVNTINSVKYITETSGIYGRTRTSFAVHSDTATPFNWISIGLYE